MNDGLPYGIIDPDYARVYTVARCIAWAEGYAILMHGSFTRDLDLLAVPWAEGATDAEHLIRRITLALDDLSLLVKDPNAPSQASQKPHGRLTWTLTFKTFGDPRFVDIGVMPRAPAPDRGDGTRADGEGWQAGAEAMRAAAAAHLHKVADGMEASCRGDLGTMFAAQSASDLRQQAKRIAELDVPPPPAAGDREGGGR